MSVNDTAERWLQESESPFARRQGPSAQSEPMAEEPEAEGVWAMPRESAATGAWGEGAGWSAEG
jgi:hypothetical protein